MYNILKIIIRIGIGLFFIVSAILKLLSLDHFELYIYSFNLFNLTWSGLAARAIIAAEILSGILLIIKVKYKAAWWLTMLMLVGFSFLLVYVILFRDDTNCHCMGDFFEIKPAYSLIKNLVGIALLLLIRKEEDFQFKKRTRMFVLVGAFLAAIVPPFVLFPIDNIYYAFSKSNNKNFNETSFNALMADSTMQDVNLNEGNYIVGIISSGCDFCRTSCLKMSQIASYNQLDSNKILFFIWGDSASVKTFPTETKTEAFRYIQIKPLMAIRITNTFPLYLFLKDGNVERTSDLHQLTENSVILHLE